MPYPEEFAGFPAGLRSLTSFGPYRAAVNRVVDGDTVVVLMDLGCNQYAVQSIRMRGVFAPEIFSGDFATRAKGQAAKAHLETLLPRGTPIVVTTEKDRVSFGRYIGIVTSQAGDVCAMMSAWLEANPVREQGAG